jgi:deoxyribose-phosphate aldolase
LEAPEAASHPTYEDIARMIEHMVVRPELTEDDVRAGCDLARSYGIAAIVIRQSDSDAVVRWMEGTGVAVASLVGLPHGSSTTPAKLYETRDLLRRGVREIDVVMNVGKLIARQFQYLETELRQVADACHESGALLKVVVQGAYLAEDLKTIACKIVKRAGADFASVSTADLPLMKRLLGERARLKIVEVETLADVLAAREAGAARVATVATRAILDEWKAQLVARRATVMPLEGGL